MVRLYDFLVYIEKFAVIARDNVDGWGLPRCYGVGGKKSCSLQQCGHLLVLWGGCGLCRMEFCVRVATGHAMTMGDRKSVDEAQLRSDTARFK